MTLNKKESTIHKSKMSHSDTIVSDEGEFLSTPTLVRPPKNIDDLPKTPRELIEEAFHDAAEIAKEEIKHYVDELVDTSSSDEEEEAKEREEQVAEHKKKCCAIVTGLLAVVWEKVYAYRWKLGGTSMLLSGMGLLFGEEKKSDS